VAAAPSSTLADWAAGSWADDRPLDAPRNYRESGRRASSAPRLDLNFDVAALQFNSAMSFSIKNSMSSFSSFDSWIRRVPLFL